MNMPDEWVCGDFLPGRETGKRHIKNHRPTYSLRVTADKRISHHAANVVTDHIGMLQVELLLKLMNVICDVRGTIAARFPRRSANAWQVNGHDGELPRQTWHHLVILVPILRKCV